MPEFKFVAVEVTNGKPSELTRSLRSHAIRAGLRRPIKRSAAKAAVRQCRSTDSRDELISGLHGGMPKLEDRSRSAISSAASVTTQDDLLKMRSVSSASAEISTGLLTCSLIPVGAGRVDPFNCLPIPANPRVDHLVRYFLMKFDLNLRLVDRKTSWFPYALQSAPMMHSTLAMSATFWRAESPTMEYSVQLEGIRQKGEAMREIRSSLTLADSARNDSEIRFLMSSMSTLVIVEAFENDFEAAEMHLRGVQNLSSLPSHRESLNSDFILCKSINVADIQVATALGRPLTFPPLHTQIVGLPLWIVRETPYSALDHSITEDGSSDRVWIFTQLKQLLLARESPEVSLEVLRVHLNLADRAILKHLYDDDIDASDASRRSRALVLAAHIFMYVTLHRIPPRSPIFGRMCTRLRNMVVGFTATGRDVWADHNAALMWIAFIGLLGDGPGVGHSPEGQWFLDIFRCTTQRHLRVSPSEAGGVSRILVAFLWDELYCRPLLVELEECHTFE